MKILITGASGFLGSALARHFVAAGDDVALLLRPGSALRRLGDAAAGCTLGRPEGDAATVQFVADCAPDAVLHTACAYGRIDDSRLQMFDTNVRLGMLLLDGLRRSGQPVRFLNTGSALAPEVSAYALGKHQFAQWGRRLADEGTGRLRFTNLVLQHMYGPGDDASKFTTYVLHACHAHQPRLALTAGEQRRDFIHIDDVVRAFATVLAQPAEAMLPDEIEVGSGQAPSIRQFVQTVRTLTGSRTVLDFGTLPYRPNEAMHSQADTRRLRALGWQPAFDLRTGLQDTIEREFAA